MRRTVLILAPVALAILPAAPAAAQWSAPFTLSTRNAPILGSPALASDARGDVVSAWGSGKGILATTGRIGRLTRPVALPGSHTRIGLQITLAVARRGGAAVAWRACDAFTGSEDCPGRVKVALRRPGSRRWHTQVVSRRGERVRRAQVAFGPDGQAELAWVGSGRVKAAFAPRGRRFGPARSVSVREPAFLQSLAVDRHGRAVVTWKTGEPEAVHDRSAYDTLRAATSSRRGRFGSPRTVASIDPNGEDLLAVSTDAEGGQISLTQRGSGAPYLSPLSYDVRSRASGEPFGAPQTISDPAQQPDVVQTPALAEAAGGDAYVAWARGPSIEVLHRPSGGAFAAPQTVVTSSDGTRAIAPDLAVSPGGQALGAFRVPDDGDTFRFNAARGGAGGFAAAAPFSERLPTSLDVFPAVAVGDGGNAVALWFNARRGGISPHVRAAFYRAAP